MTKLDLPRYFIVGDRPVKAVSNRGGGIDVLALDWTTGEFVPGGAYVPRIFLPDADIRRVSVKEFDQTVLEVRRAMGPQDLSPEAKRAVAAQRRG